MALVQVLPQDGAWIVKQNGAQQGSAYTTQAEAEREGRSLVKLAGSEFQLHGEDGKIREKAPTATTHERVAASQGKSNMRVTRGTLTTVLAAAFLAATPVMADDATRSDPREMGDRGLDIAMISQGHLQRASDGDWRLVHTITMYQKWRTRELRCYGSISLRIKDNNRSVRIVYRDGDLRGRIEDARGKFVGRAYVTRPDQRSATVRIRPRHLGRVGRSYAWRVSAETTGCGCDDNGSTSASCPAVSDAAPHRGYMSHRRDLD